MPHPSEAWRRTRPASAPTRGLWWSAAAHLFLLLAIALVHRQEALPPEPPPQPSFDVVFEGAPAPTHGVPVPGKHTAIPRGETSNRPTPTPPQAAPPPSPPVPPRVNILPPEYAERVIEPPPPEQRETEAVPRPSPREARRRVQREARNNPFAHVMPWSFAPAAPARPSRGLRDSRSLDLAMGPVIRGGQIVDAVTHVVSPGASSDYIAGISEYVESHKYYPPEAVRNGEQGTSVLEVTIARDGQVRGVRLRESAGSRWLDMAWESLFRSHRFAPFPDDMKEAERTFTLSMDFELYYR